MLLLLALLSGESPGFILQVTSFALLEAPLLLLAGDLERAEKRGARFAFRRLHRWYGLCKQTNLWKISTNGGQQVIKNKIKKHFFVEVIFHLFYC